MLTILCVCVQMVTLLTILCVCAFRRCTFTSLMGVGRAWLLRERNFSCIGFAATSSSSARRARPCLEPLLCTDTILFWGGGVGCCWFKKYNINFHLTGNFALVEQNTTALKHNTKGSYKPFQNKRT
jgi:hypothetical protein